MFYDALTQRQYTSNIIYCSYQGHKLQVSENRVFRETFGPKDNDVREQFMKFMVFWVVWWLNTSVSWDRAASVLRVEVIVTSHGATNQKRMKSIFTAVKTTNIF
jgi:hypothetical protein